MLRLLLLGGLLLSLLRQLLRLLRASMVMQGWRLLVLGIKRVVWWCRDTGVFLGLRRQSWWLLLRYGFKWWGKPTSTLKHS
jgi:hypothetical protein